MSVQKSEKRKKIKNLAKSNCAEITDQNNCSNKALATASPRHLTFRQGLLASMDGQSNATKVKSVDRLLPGKTSPCGLSLRPKSTPVDLLSGIPGLAENELLPKWKFSKLSFPTCPLPPPCPHVSREKSKQTKRRKIKKVPVKNVEKPIKLKMNSDSFAKVCYNQGHIQRTSHSLPRKLTGKTILQPVLANLKSISKKKRLPSVNKFTNTDKKRLVRKKSTKTTAKEKIEHKETLECPDKVQYDQASFAKAEQTTAEIMGTTEEDSSSCDSTSECRKETHKLWAANNQVLQDIEAVRIDRIEEYGFQEKKHRKKRHRAKSVRAVRVKRNLGIKTENVAREQARVAVEELCRQASAVMNSISPPDFSASPTPGQMTEQFKAKLDQGKGKHNISSSRIAVVSYPSSKLVDAPSLQTIPRTYQQLGLPPLERSPSSQNYFPKMAAFFRGEEGNIPAIRSPPRPRESRRDRQLSQQAGQTKLIGQYFDSDSNSRSPRGHVKTCVSCVECLQLRKLKPIKPASSWTRGKAMRQTLTPFYRDI